MRAVLPLINALHQQNLSSSILVSTNTPTGKQVLTDQLNTQIKHVYLPWDNFFLIKRLLKRVNAKQLLIIETEIWPMLYELCKRQHINLSIINARLSNKTLNAPGVIKKLYRQSLSNCNAILCQSDLHKQRYQQLSNNPNIQNCWQFKTT